MSNETTCTIRHEALDKVVEEHGKRLDEVEHNQKEYEKNSIRNDILINTLCKKLDFLTNTLIAIAGATVLTLFGFLIWYIQKL